MKVLFLFGPNLGALGRRDPAVYGSATLAELMGEVEEKGLALGHEVAWRQSDHEGDLVGWLLGARDEGADAVIINPGALTHYSYALRDAVEASGVPVVEVHLSNIYAREEFRRHSVVSEVCRATITGLGAGGYHLALEAIPWITGRLRALEVDALLVSHLPNVRYLTGFTGSNGQALVGAKETVFLTDGRYQEQSRREVLDLDRVTYLQGLEGPLRDVCARMGVVRLGFEAHALTVRQHGQLVAKLPDVELIALADEVERQRWTKDPEEIAHLRSAQGVTDQAFEDVMEYLAVGQTERQVARELEHLLRRHGADGLAFDSIVAFGENAAEPHHEPSHRLLEEGDVIKLDFGAMLEGYHADMTRTIAFGSPASQLKKIHDVVREAQQEGIDAVRAGVAGESVDQAAREVIEDAGYGVYFLHGLGHGVGLEIHEGPRLGRGIDHELPAGAVVTVEPGIYIPGLGGVRIEDMVEVTDDGCRVLGTSVRDLVEL
jgi:3-dehydroquinate dehydratase type II